MSARGMVMTVGVGMGGAKTESLLRALKKSVQKIRPDILALVYSSKSKEGATKLRELLGDHNREYDRQLSDENNADKCFTEIVTLVEQMCRELKCDREIFEVDFTSGTKAMSAAAVLAAVASGIGGLRYIAGERKNGTVQAGLEEFITISPTRCLAYYNLKTAIENLRALRYTAARAILDTIPDHALSDEHRCVKTQLCKLVDGYEAWDLFHHQTALESFREINTDIHELREFLFPRKQFSLLAGLAKVLTPADGKPEFTEDVLADLCNNAKRRMLEGKFDDACARLYRLTEMCAQFVLQKHGIDTAHVREEQVPEKHRHEFVFELVKEGQPPEARLGLYKSFCLLKYLGDPVGELVAPKSSFGNLLSVRNQSILAHGVEPVSRETCEKFLKHVHNLVTRFVPDFDQRCRDLQFPWLVD